MYGLFALSMVIMIRGFYDKFVLIKGNQKLFGPQGLIPCNPFKLSWSTFFKTIFLQGKIPRHKKIGLIHALIYYGFIILWIATDLVAIHYDTPFKVFQGTTYIVVSFLADVGGVALLIGLLFAYKRRYIDKPDFLTSTHPQQEKYMYAMLFNLVVVGFLIEGLRILGTDDVTNAMVNEKIWAPFGWLLANLFQSFHLSEETLSSSYRLLWLWHMFSTMFFIASIGHSKFSHIIMAPLSALFNKDFEKGVLAPMDFTREDAETFGLGKLSELTVKERFDTEVCVECGRCTQACPAHLADKPLNPKTIITKMRDFLHEQEAMQQSEANIWESNIYSANELDSCTTCGACMEECPVNIEHVQLIMDLKRYKVLTNGDIPPAAADATNKIRLNGNPWGISADSRFQWADGLEVPVIEAGKKVDYLYYVGCAGSYDAANQKVVRDTVMLLKKAGVDFAVMGKTEKCNGDPVRRFGDEYNFFEIAIENIANMRQYTFDKVVTHCPHCLHTIGKEYAKFENGDFQTVHHTELLADLLKTGRLKAEKEIKEETTFHDPCYLGRHHGEYNAPREVLKAIPGLTVKEMERNKDKSLCCGMGGGNMWYELPEGHHLANNRLQDIKEVNVPKVSSACSFCLINFNSARGHVPGTDELIIEDVASTLAKSVL